MAETKKKKGHYFRVANEIFDLRLKPRDFIVYCCLLRHSNSRKHSCFPSRRVIASECQIDKKTVDTALNSLIDRGLIKKVHRKRGDGSKTSNQYYIVDLLETDGCDLQSGGLKTPYQ